MIITAGWYVLLGRVSTQHGCPTRQSNHRACMRLCMRVIMASNLLPPCRWHQLARAEWSALLWICCHTSVRAQGPEENPYRSLDPILEPSKCDEFYYQNYYVYCGRGQATKP